MKPDHDSILRHYNHGYLLCPRTGTADTVLFLFPLVFWWDTDTPLQLSPERLRAETSILEYDQGWVIAGRLMDANGKSWVYPDGSKIYHTHTRVWVHDGATFYVVETPDPPLLVFEALASGIKIPDSEKKQLRLPRFDVSLANGWLERAGQSTNSRNLRHVGITGGCPRSPSAPRVHTTRRVLQNSK